MNFLASLVLQLMLLLHPFPQSVTFPGPGNPAPGGGGGTPTLTPENLCGGTANCAGKEGFVTTEPITGLTFTTGWIAICDVAGVGASALTCADTSLNTWTPCVAKWTGNFVNEEFYSVISTGGSDTVTGGATGASYMWTSVTAEQSSSGWPASPCDQTSTQTQASGTNGTYTITASANNAKAVELEHVALISSAAVSGCYGSTTAGYTLSTEGTTPTNSGIYARASSVIETASFSYTLTGCSLHVDQMLGTYKAN